MTEDPISQRKLYIKTFGCQMNEYDSEKIRVLLSKEYTAAEQPEDADVVIVNTCSVREKGEHKLFSLLGELRDLKKVKPELVIGVGGCVAQQEGKNIISRSPTVDFVVGTHNLSLIPGLIGQVKSGHGRQVAIDYREDWEDLPHEFLPASTKPVQVYSPSDSPVRALVSIQRGCNKRCAFCVVPTTRGPELSRDEAEILREVRAKVRMGAREVMLLGQTVNSYGRDLSPRRSFADLIRRLAEIENLQRIRFTSPHPGEVREDFIALYSEVPQLARHIHLPVQSGNDRVLKAMNRNYRIRRYKEIVSELRSSCPDIALSTDIIVGFPTESDAEFEDTLNLIKEVRYHAAYYFKYSRRPNTVAETLYTEQDEIQDSVLDNRFNRLHLLQKDISLELNRSEVGEVRQVLVEGLSPASVEPGLLRGRSSQNTIVEFAGPIELIGQLVDVRINMAKSHHQKGELCGVCSESFQNGKQPLKTVVTPAVEQPVY